MTWQLYFANPKPRQMPINRWKDKYIKLHLLNAILFSNTKKHTTNKYNMQASLKNWVQVARHVRVHITWSYFYKTLAKIHWICNNRKKISSQVLEEDRLLKWYKRTSLKEELVLYLDCGDRYVSTHTYRSKNSCSCPLKIC